MNKMTMILFVLILIKVAVTDWKTKKIPNIYIWAIAVLGCIRTLFGQQEMFSFVCGFFIVGVPMFLITLIRPGAFGGGDIKLMAVSGMVLGWEKCLSAFVCAVFFSGIYCLFLIICKKSGRKTAFPMGPFFCLGMMIEIF